MPLPMVHLLVADKISNMDKTPEYYLGAISPDAVHMRDDYERKHKTDSHFAIKNVGTLEDLNEFYEIIENCTEKERKDFLKAT